MPIDWPILCFTHLLWISVSLLNFVFLKMTLITFGIMKAKIYFVFTCRTVQAINMIVY